MHLNIIFMGLLAISFTRLGNTQREPNSENKEAECRIYNSPLNRYLFAQSKFLGLSSTRSLGLLKELDISGMYYVIPGKKNDIKHDSAVWLFEPVPGRPRTYFIQNIKYKNEYLRGSEKYIEFFSKKNHVVYVEFLKNQVDDESFMWRIEPTSEKQIYHIWNVKFNSPLFSNVYLMAYLMREHKRNSNQPFHIGLSPKQPDSEDFKWIFKCRNGILPDVN